MSMRLSTKDQRPGLHDRRILRARGRAIDQGRVVSKDRLVCRCDCDWVLMRCMPLTLPEGK